MLDFLKSLLEQQPLMALFLTIAIGYLVGEINIKGFSLGVGAVLFVALGMGWFAPKSVPSAMVGTLGLALFLYGVGIQYGKQFFTGLTSRDGRATLMMPHPERVFRTLQMSWHPAGWGEDSPWLRIFRNARAWVA